MRVQPLFYSLTQASQSPEPPSDNLTIQHRGRLSLSFRRANAICDSSRVHRPDEVQAARCRPLKRYPPKSALLGRNRLVASLATLLLDDVGKLLDLALGSEKGAELVEGQQGDPRQA
jgi:hypothetical protein